MTFLNDLLVRLRIRFAPDDLDLPEKNVGSNRSDPAALLEQRMFPLDVARSLLTQVAQVASVPVQQQSRAVSPDGSVLLAGAQIGTLRSVDGGKTWEPVDRQPCLSGTGVAYHGQLFSPPPIPGRAALTLFGGTGIIRGPVILAKAA